MAHQLHFLGTSDGAVGPRRKHASILLTFGGRKILLDCGEPCSHSLVQSGVQPDEIDSIFISHLHSDHVGGFPMVIQWCWLAGRKRPLPVRLPREGILPFRQLLRTTYLFDELLGFDLLLKPWKANEEIRIGPVRVQKHPNGHLAGLKRSFQRKYGNAFESFSFRFTHRGASLVYSGDIREPADLDPLLEKETEVLVVELAHFELAALTQYLSQKDVRKIYITHLGAHYQSRLAALRREAARRMPGRRVIFAEDGLKVAF